MAVMKFITAIFSFTPSLLEGEDAKTWACASKPLVFAGEGVFFLFMVLCLSGTAYAGQAEVRDVALTNNCTPKKIEVYQQSLGAAGDTVYRVQCTLPKAVGTADGAAKPPDAILVSCTQNLCDMLRAVSMEKK